MEEQAQSLLQQVAVFKCGNDTEIAVTERAIKEKRSVNSPMRKPLAKVANLDDEWEEF